MKFYVFFIREKLSIRKKKCGNWELKDIKELTLNMRKQVKKKRKTINKLRISNFFWKPETDPKMKKPIQIKRKPINQQRIKNLFLKTGNGPKKWGNKPIKRGNWSTNWEFKTFFFLKTGNVPQRRGNELKTRGNQSTNWGFKTFFCRLKADPKKEEMYPKKRGNWSTNWD